jgi:hypothetical protein
MTVNFIDYHFHLFQELKPRYGTTLILVMRSDLTHGSEAHLMVLHQRTRLRGILFF